MIGILDLDIGNLRSLSNAIYSLGYDFTLVANDSHFEELTHLVIPGVGAYATAMRHADERGLREPVKAFAGSGKPVLGICLGMQLLSSWGDEAGGAHGFGIVPGKVVQMEPGAGLNLPHVGWNGALLQREHPAFRGLKTGRDFYFVHSYHFVCDEPADALARTDYGIPFTSIVGRDNVLGLQFHPEKSQGNGLKLLENFCKWNGRC